MSIGSNTKSVQQKLHGFCLVDPRRISRRRRLLLGNHSVSNTFLHEETPVSPTPFPFESPTKKIPRQQELRSIFFVDLGTHFWNRFATECDYLMMIMREYNADKIK